MVVGLFFLRGANIIGTQALGVVKDILMPGYMIFSGIMLGYILAQIQIGYEEDKTQTTKIYTKFFLIGTGIGILLGVIYIIL
ncbi:MAG: hypothetical protein WCO66_03250 [Candidatus Absconditabacteria bacterium]